MIQVDFPGGSMVKNPPAHAGDMNMTPGPGRFHMLWGNWARGPQLLKPSWSRASALQQEKPLQREAHTSQLESNSCLLQPEKAHAQQWKLSTAKKKFFFQNSKKNKLKIKWDW